MCEAGGGCVRQGGGAVLQPEAVDRATRSSRSCCGIINALAQCKNVTVSDLQRRQLRAHGRMRHYHLGGIHAAAQRRSNRARFLRLGVPRRICNENIRASCIARHQHILKRNTSSTSPHARAADACTCSFDGLQRRHGARQRVVATHKNAVDVEEERNTTMLHLERKQAREGDRLATDATPHL